VTRAVEPGTWGARSHRAALHLLAEFINLKRGQTWRSLPWQRQQLHWNSRGGYRPNLGAAARLFPCFAILIWHLSGLRELSGPRGGWLQSPGRCLLSSLMPFRCLLNVSVKCFAAIYQVSPIQFKSNRHLPDTVMIPEAWQTLASWSTPLSLNSKHQISWGRQFLALELAYLDWQHGFASDWSSLAVSWSSISRQLRPIS